MLEAGFSRVDITPLRGTELAGWAFGPSLRVLHPLQAAAAAFRSDEQIVLLISLDLLAIDLAYGETIRQRIERTYGVPSDAILLACTHTHSGPATASLGPWGRPDPAYCQILSDRLVQLAGQTLSNLEPARLSATTVKGPPVAVNRCLGEEAPVNDNLTVVQASSADGAPIGLLLNFACHPVNMHDSGDITPDFPFYTREAIVQHLADVPILYFSGASGDLNPANFKHGNAAPSRAKETGAAVGKAALEASAHLAPEADSNIIAFTRRAAKVKLAPLPPRHEIESYRDEAVAKLNALPDSAIRSGEFGSLKIRHDWATRALATLKAGEVRSERSIPIWGLRIGCVCVVGLPGELFSEYEIELRREQPDTPLIVATTTNGCLGYFPSPPAYQKEAYEAVFCPRLLGLQAYSSDVGQLLITEVRSLIRQLDSPEEERLVSRSSLTLNSAAKPQSPCH